MRVTRHLRRPAVREGGDELVALLPALVAQRPLRLGHRLEEVVLVLDLAQGDTVISTENDSNDRKITVQIQTLLQMAVSNDSVPLG